VAGAVRTFILPADELARISGNWKPYRTWTTLLLRTFLEDETGETAGRRPPGGSA